ncbi:MAG: imidazoleglycerol-phosphate dehydratase HisB [Clostridia bacterium]|nr:imidazoleglycerol-phosphate dehydratase HisB [Clostridia bacterium]
MRTAEIKRTTYETDITLKLCIEGKGNSKIDTGCGFLDHMLTLFSKHGNFDLEVKCKGDTFVDDHHTVEDVGICLGEAFNKALGDKKGIYRYGNFCLPMDEALVLTAVDFSGRSYLGFGLEIPSQKIGTFDTELVEEFWTAFVRKAECSLHFKQFSGTNSHHIVESAFKSAARTIKEAVKIDPDNADSIPSTKGKI